MIKKLNKKAKREISHYAFFPKSRKGSHVSFIISFILFISFIIFFIGIIKPFDKVETGKSSLLKHLENEIIKNVTGDVEVISAIEKNGGNYDCSDINSIMKNKNNKIENINGILKIYPSEEFEDEEFQNSCTNQKYEIGLIRTQKYVFQSKILKLNESYDLNYENVKENFGISETNDFEFSLLNISESPIIKTSSKEIPSTETLAELIPVIYFDENSEIKNGYIKVVLW